MRQLDHARHFLIGHPVVEGNVVTLLVDGAQAFPAMLAAIAEAKRSIAVESYIYADDSTGRRFLDALVERAGHGVAVRLLIDGVGSLGTPNEFFEPLRRLRGQALVYRPPMPWLPAWGFWNRNHRKLLLIDDRVAFIGGLNIADEYAPKEWGGGAWHDMHARIDGPAARDLTKLFNRTWARVSREDWNHRLAHVASSGEVPIQVLENRLVRRHMIQRSYLQAIRHARHRIRITNAYFIPDRAVRRALHNALGRGVQVQLLLAGRTDIRAVLHASRALYARLLRWGAEIYEWTERVLHSKCAVIDGVWCSIGSYNLDRRSLLHNLEVNVAFLDTEVGGQLEREFERDMARSTRIERETWHRRPALDKVLEQLFFSLRYFL